MTDLYFSATKSQSFLLIIALNDHLDDAEVQQSDSEEALVTEEAEAEKKAPVIEEAEVEEKSPMSKLSGQEEPEQSAKEEKKNTPSIILDQIQSTID